MKAFFTKAIWHWSATPRTWGQPNHYHAIVTETNEQARLRRLTPYTEVLREATAGRNSTTISLCIACMSPTLGTWSLPPTERQIDVLCEESARISLEQNWDPRHLDRYWLTHAEAAALRDYPVELVRRFSYPEISGQSADWDHLAQASGLPTANYGPASWPDGWPGGDVVRWDLFKLSEHAPDGSGGHALRQRTREWMLKLK